MLRLRCLHCGACGCFVAFAAADSLRRRCMMSLPCSTLGFFFIKSWVSIWAERLPRIDARQPKCSSMHPKSPALYFSLLLMTELSLPQTASSFPERFLSVRMSPHPGLLVSMSRVFLAYTPTPTFIMGLLTQPTPHKLEGCAALLEVLPTDVQLTESGCTPPKRLGEWRAGRRGAKGSPLPRRWL